MNQPIPPLILGFVQCSIGPFQEGVELLVPWVQLRQSEAHGDPESGPLEQNSAGLHGTAKTFSDLPPSFQGCLWQQDGELLAPNTAHKICLSQGGQTNLGKRDESMVAPTMTMGIVDSLEKVNVQHEQGQRPVVTF
jgi:hypothetical protein